jgi:EthD domain
VFRKVQLLLVLRPGTDARSLAPFWDDHAKTVGQRTPGLRYRQAVRLDDDPTQQTAHSAEMRDAPPPFDVVVDFGDEDASTEDLLSAVKGVGRSLASAVDAERSAALLGTEHVIVAGTRPLILVFPLRRLDALTYDEFHDHWLQKHAALARAIPVIQAYRQFHALPAESDAAAEAAGVAISDFEGAAEGYYQDLQSFLDIMSAPEVVADAIEDERRFIDHSRSVMGLYQFEVEAVLRP